MVQGRQMLRNNRGEKKKKNRKPAFKAPRMSLQGTRGFKLKKKSEGNVMCSSETLWRVSFLPGEKTLPPANTGRKGRRTPWQPQGRGDNSEGSLRTISVFCLKEVVRLHAQVWHQQSAQRNKGKQQRLSHITRRMNFPTPSCYIRMSFCCCLGDDVCSKAGSQNHVLSFS